MWVSKQRVCQTEKTEVQRPWGMGKVGKFQEQGGEARAGVSPGCCGRRPEGGSCVPELPPAGLADMWDVEQRVHIYGFGMFIWSFYFTVMPP